jgi:hypothetical protein
MSNTFLMIHLPLICLELNLMMLLSLSGCVMLPYEYIIQLMINHCLMIMYANP